MGRDDCGGAEAGLETVEQRLRALIESSTEATGLIDAAGVIRYASPSTTRVLGYAAEACLGRRAFDFVHPDDRQYVRKLATPLVQQPRGVVSAQYRVRHQDGSWRWLLGTATNLLAEPGVHAIVVSHQDITERKLAEEAAGQIIGAPSMASDQSTSRQTEEALRRHAAELEAMNRELEAFSSSVSHDLRTPLTSIMGYNELLLDRYVDRLDDTGRAYLRAVHAASERMAQIIDDMLQLSRAGRAELQTEPVDLSALVGTVAADLRRLEPERRADFVIAPSVVVHGDRRLLRMAMENLVGNAWKFTRPQSLPRIEFGVAECDGQTVYFVRDNGAGFDMAEAHRLFRPFQRLHSERTFPGTGVGLATVQRIIERHGGRVWAAGAVGHGATFSFLLPSRPAATALSPRPHAPDTRRDADTGGSCDTGVLHRIDAGRSAATGTAHATSSRRAKRLLGREGGSHTRKVDPRPTSVSTVTVPPSMSSSRRTM
jgi:PAS domain S-box-containing protein